MCDKRSKLNSYDTLKTKARLANSYYRKFYKQIRIHIIISSFHIVY